MCHEILFEDKLETPSVKVYSFQTAFSASNYEFIKLDIEGADLNLASSGCQKLIKHARVAVLEFSAARLRKKFPGGRGLRKFEDSLKFFWGAGYTHVRCWVVHRSRYLTLS